MIKKIVSIQGIGRFHEHRDNDNALAFERNTILFAPNAYGKSTLAVVLKSLANNDPAVIQERRTLGGQLPQRTVIRFVDDSSEYSVTYENGCWEIPSGRWRPRIRIFDSAFVHGRLFHQEITSDHKKTIHAIIVGEQGDRLSDAVQKANDEQREATRAFNALNSALVDRCNRTGRQDYLDVAEADQEAVSAEIRTLDRQLKGLESQDTVLKLPSIPLIDEIPSPPFSRLRGTLSQSHTAADEDAKNLVDEHFRKNFKRRDDASSFVRTGLAQGAEHCPFCGQNLLAARTLLEAYNAYFDQSHQYLQREIECVQKEWQECIPDRWENRIRENLENVNAVVLKWRACLGSDFGCWSVALPPYTSGWRMLADLCQHIHDRFATKLANLDEEVDLTQLDEFEQIVTTANQAICDFNDDIRDANEEIESYRNSLRTAETLADVRARQQKLKELLKRFLPDEMEWCKDFRVAKERLGLATQAHDECRAQLAKYSESIFAEYQSGINRVLERLGTSFRLNAFQGIADKRTAGAYADFQIVINDTAVPLQAQGQPCFGNTLSEGDKNSLALAFWIADLEKAVDLGEMILVFDDPLSSLDETRRHRTALCIRDVSQKARQTVILTHNKPFAFHLWDELKSRTALALQSDVASGSRLISFDVEEERRLEQHKRILRMEKYCDADFGPSPNEIQKDIRECLEAAIKFKYFRYLRCLEHPTLGVMLDVLERETQIDGALLGECRDLNNFSSPAHHAPDHVDPLQAVTRDEVIVEVRKTLEVLERL